MATLPFPKENEEFHKVFTDSSPDDFVVECNHFSFFLRLKLFFFQRL